MALTTSWERKGLRQGRKEGKQQGLREGVQQGLREGVQQGLREGELRLLLRLLEKRVGPLSSTVEHRIGALDSSQIADLTDCLYEIESLQQVQEWLDVHTAGRSNG